MIGLLASYLVLLNTEAVHSVHFTDFHKRIRL